MPKKPRDAKDAELENVSEVIARERARLRWRIETFRGDDWDLSAQPQRRRGRLFDIIRHCMGE